MPSAVNVAGDVIVAATALGGFIFVYLGAIAASFDTFEKIEKASVRAKFQMRGWLGFVGFVLALLSAALALLTEWLQQACLGFCALALLLGALFFVLYVALDTVRGIT
jgi:hypothetical protein